MKSKILAALKSKHTGFDAAVYDGVADYLSKSVTDENNISAAVEAVEPVLKAFQAEADRRVNSFKTEADRLKAEKAELEKKLKEKEPGTPPGSDPEEPAWAKKLREQNEALALKLGSIENEKTQVEIRASIAAKLKDKVDQKYINSVLSGRTFKDAAEGEAFATQIESDWTDLQQSIVEKVPGQNPPTFGKRDNEGVSAAVSQFLNDKKSDTGLEGKKI